MKFLFPAISITVLLGFACRQVHAQTSEMQLSKYQCQVVMENPHRVEVTALIQVQGAKISDELTNTVVHYDGQQIEGVRVNDQKDRPLQFTDSSKGRVMKLKLSASSLIDSTENEATYTLNYKVQSTSGDILRVPLPVPRAQTRLGERPVQITLEVPQGFTAMGDAFPAFVWTDRRIGRVSLPDVPSFVVARVGLAMGASLSARIFTPGNFSDAAIVSLIILGSAIWKRRYRSGSATRRT